LVPILVPIAVDIEYEYEYEEGRNMRGRPAQE
jgi:hypothetical protein